MTDRFEAGEFTLEKVRDYVWELPQEGDMRVPARVLASRELLEQISDDKTLQQLRNTTHLPGIRKHAICMPDGHQGYGFPVGGVAGIDAEDGCISPGAVGYDINCVPGDTDVRLDFGRRIPIAALESRFEDERAVVAGETATPSDIRLFTESDARQVYEVTTEAGDTVQATADHPFRTPNGMVELSDLEPGDTVAVSPFRGVEHEDPDEFILVEESDLEDASPQLVASLKDNNLLPLKSTDEAFARLLTLVGFHTGAGSFSAEQTWFYAAPADLERIREDIAALGFTATRVSEREPDHGESGTAVERTACSLTVDATGFKRLLVELGAPTGRTSSESVTVPDYMDRLPDWQCALYLSAYFGAEMTTPAVQSDKSQRCPAVAQDRAVDVADAGEQFLREIATHLEGLGVETNGIERDRSASNENVVRLRLGVKADSQNLIRFFERVGYRYNESKQREALAAAQYLKRTARADKRRAGITDDATAMTDGGCTVPENRTRFDVDARSAGQGTRSGRDDRPRSSAEFPDYEEFRASLTVHGDMTVEATVESIEPAGHRRVYDIGVAHDAHTFLADGFVVSNCGVRMLRTNLTYDDVRGHEEQLVDALFEAIPSGLGGGGVVEGDRDTIEGVLERGMDWALEAGWAVEDDLKHCEDEGRRSDADPSVVSQKAKDRGRNQLGSLGSGNHFLEVQRVTDIFREDVAEAYGLERNQIVVLIHCGSRGLGHQTCNDYLRDIEQAHPGLLSQLPDKELAAAPAGSQLAEDYYGAMCAAINFAWVNRQLIMHRTREVFEDVFGHDWQSMGMYLLYDVAHNIAKKEVHDLGDEERELYVHRKGATRAFPAGRPEVPAAYRETGQPVIIPGSMGAGSYVLRGGAASMTDTFGSTAHGAGRLMSRTRAKNEFWGGDVQDDLREQNHVYVKAQSGATIAEEAPGVYKDVDEVVRVSDALGIGDKVARTFPVCNIKG